MQEYIIHTFNGTITIMRLHAYPIGADVHSYIHTLYMYERERERETDVRGMGIETEMWVDESNKSS